jgi:outer membrane protein
MVSQPTAEASADRPRSHGRLAFFLGAVGASLLGAQAQERAPTRLTLAQAEEIALARHPHLAVAALLASAEDQGVREARAAEYPTISGSVTAVLAFDDTTITSGALATSSLSSRAAAGLSVSQLVTNFGRTAHLVGAARARALAAARDERMARSEVRRAVRTAYYEALEAQAVSTVAQVTLDDRRLTARKVEALARSSLRSSLDASFAQLLVSDAELAEVEAQSGIREGTARLGQALGDEQPAALILVDEADAPLAAPDPEAAVASALDHRPDVQALISRATASSELARAQRALSYPTLSVQGAAGLTPWHDPSIAHDYYGAVDLEVRVPIFTGGLYSGLQAEAEDRAHADDRALAELRQRVAADVRVAVAQVDDAYRRLDVTARMLPVAARALHLAQSRYETGLGDILEVNQAQLLATSAALALTSARYGYFLRRTDLDYATGALQ